MITTGIVLSFEAVLYVRVVVPSLTEDTVLLPTPPKKPMPDTEIVTGLPLEPEVALSPLTVGAGVVTVNLSADTVAVVPPRAVTVISYVPRPSPEGMITPVMVLSLEAPLFESERVPSFTDDTVLLPIPPKKPVPFMLMVTGLMLEPVLVLSDVTAGAGVVTVNLSANTVALVPPKAATVMSYVPGV